MHPIDWLVVIVYLGALAALTLMVRRARSVEDFAVASRELPTPIVFATLAASYIGPGYSVGLAGKAADKGYVWFLIFSAFCVQTLVVGWFVAPRIQQFKTARTVGDILGQRYGRTTQFVAGLLTLALLTGFIGVMARASADIISEITGLPLIWAAAASAVVVIAYSTYGGIKADIANDVLQFIILSIGVPLLLIFAIRHNGYSILSDAWTRSQPIGSALPPATLVGLVLSFLLGEMLIPPYTVRALAARDPTTARHGFALAAVFGIAWFFICATLGVVAHAAAPDEEPAGIFLYAMKHYLPPGLFALVLVAVVAIILSSWDSLLNCASSAFQCDLLSLLRPELRDSRFALASSRLLNVVIGIAATAFAVSVSGLVEALLYCYTLWAPTVLLPLLIAVFKRDVQPAAGLIAIFAGGIATGIWEWGLHQPLAIPSLVIGLAANQLAFWLTDLLLRTKPGMVPKSPQSLDDGGQ